MYSQKLVNDVCRNDPIRLFFALEKETLDFFLNIQKHLITKLDTKTLDKRKILKNVNKFLMIWNMILKRTKKLNSLFAELATKLRGLNSNDNVSYKKISYVLLSEIILEGRIGKYISYVLKSINLPVTEEFKMKIDALYKTINKLITARSIWKDDLIRFHIPTDYDSQEEYYTESDHKDSMSQYTDDSDDLDDDLTHESEESQNYSSKNTFDIQELVKLLGKNVSHNVSLKELSIQSDSGDTFEESIEYNDEHDMDSPSDSDSSVSETKNPESFQYKGIRDDSQTDIYSDLSDLIVDDLPHESDDEVEGYVPVDNEKKIMYKNSKRSIYPSILNVFKKQTTPVKDNKSVDELVRFIEGEDSKKKSKKKKKKKKKKAVKSTDEDPSNTLTGVEKQEEADENHTMPEEINKQLVVDNTNNDAKHTTIEDIQISNRSPVENTTDSDAKPSISANIPKEVKGENTKPINKGQKSVVVSEKRDMTPMNTTDKATTSIPSGNLGEKDFAKDSLESSISSSPSEEEEEIETILKICELRTVPQSKLVKNRQHLENVALWALQDDRNKFKGR